MNNPEMTIIRIQQVWTGGETEHDQKQKNIKSDTPLIDPVRTVVIPAGIAHTGARFHRPTKEHMMSTAKSNKSFWLTPNGLAAIALIGAVAYFLLVEHRAHLLQWLPWLIIALCPLLHVFMHRGHGRDDDDRHGHSGHKHDDR